MNNIHCPKCGGPTEGGFVEIDGLKAVQECTCKTCNAEWYDVYEMTEQIVKQ